ncbi:hypothetical protein [Kitasatospora sp. NPDC001132]
MSADRWSVTGSGHDHRLDVALNDRDFAEDMHEIRENGHFISRHRHRRRRQAEATVRQLLADGVEIGERTPGPAPAASARRCPTARWHQARPILVTGLPKTHI